MNNVLKLSALALSAVLVAGCVGGDDASNSSSNERTSSTSSSDVREESGSTVSVAAVGEEASAGDVVHVVNEVEVLAEIPESYTLEEWELIAEATPAAEGFQWVRIMGSVTNNTGESQSLDSTNVVVVDSEDREFKVSTDTTIYVDSDSSPVYLSVQPTQTVDWEGYFMVPEGEGYMLKANDLTFLGEDEVLIDLGV